MKTGSHDLDRELREESTIRTEIESNDHYRARLSLIDLGNGVLIYISPAATSAELDAIGKTYGKIRIHNYICTPVKKVEV